MPIWHGYWGGPWVGFGWIVPLLGLTLMVVMILVCMRRMGGLWHCGCLPSSRPPAAPEIEALRREIQDLREELHKRREHA
ncbi:MAG: hypothetical protein H6Q86_566 [candidate division NC10 bacterium]|nr:hypothetical protein [candidate division NC10 bacterium]